MISKKDALTLGILAVGGIAAASVVADSDTGGGGGAMMEGIKGRAGGILGGEDVSQAAFKTPQEPTVIFSKGRDYSDLLQSFIGGEEAPADRGTAGISSAGKKRPVTPYIYTGGEVKPGAVSVAPWAMGRTTPTEIGVTTALSVARGGTTPAAAPKKKEIKGARAVRPGRMGYGAGYAKSHGL